ncbi:YbjN domain-containing protein [Parvularcula sp. LCG005]|uniref:YbjN domain-containing protein n=1 Tax=Parvularcula sp. LCG005 TaxID=3078805 RepID=UPI002942C95D|nr:YbjN domain-containing protein [Parvularcula sp. LCG005]WOI53198.1 YbjN domain-containing protein [Parvularcula sp. LCG005]
MGKGLVIWASAAMALAAFSGATASAAPKEMVQDSISANELEMLLTEAGLTPTMLTDKTTGAPVATGQANGMVFVVRTLDCSGRPKRCGQLLLFANFDLGRGVTDDDYRIVNGFNESNVNGRAYVLEDKSQIGIDFIIDMTGGVTETHIGSRLGRWPGVIRDFKEEMVGAQTGM